MWKTKYGNLYLGILTLQKKYDMAVIFAEENISSEELEPNLASNLSVLMRKTGRLKESLIYIYAALKVNPNDERYIYNLSQTLISCERYEEARVLLVLLIEKTERMKPKIYSSLARIYCATRNFDLAKAAAQFSLEIDKNDEAALTCLALAMDALNNTLESIKLFNTIIYKNKSDSIFSNWQYALFCLKHGNFYEGWKFYHWGFKVANKGRGVKKFNTTCEYSPEIYCAHLVVHGEQGVGDEVLFLQLLRCLPATIESVRLELDPRLEWVSQGLILGNKIRILEQDADLKDTSHIMIGDLPSLYFNDFVKSPLRGDRYITTKSISESNIIGISWRGGASKISNKQRSIDIYKFMHIMVKIKAKYPLSIFNVLQYNYDTEEHNLIKNFLGSSCYFPDYDPINNIEKWAESIARCTLIISIDNSAVHIAGSLGIPTIMLGGISPNWRWTPLEGTDSNIWYKSVSVDKTDLDSSSDVFFERIDKFMHPKINTTS